MDENKQITKAVEKYVDSWDMDTLVGYAQEQLTEYYLKSAYEIDLGLLTAVCNQIQEDVNEKDYTAIEELFKYLDNPELRLKGFLREN